MRSELGRYKTPLITVQALETSKSVLEEKHSSTLTSMSVLAATFSKRVRWTEAE